VHSTRSREFKFLLFNATFSNISAISWRPVLVVEEAGVPGENHRPWANNFITCGCESSAPFCNLQSRERTHADPFPVGKKNLFVTFRKHQIYSQIDICLFRYCNQIILHQNVVFNTKYYTTTFLYDMIWYDNDRFTNGNLFILVLFYLLWTNDVTFVNKSAFSTFCSTLLVKMVT
jgi:hypothetical protein